ncbi:hypothetical protein HK099_007327 [Clydaea vesicula]|uniref:Uncharacterized protein n=1 Tax=Clydaea vesicula TaxID=447962 RepID=A0AAD5U886_9FUNG|nr:hypothetical protein HK099_007327 [Clydaea vesicula]
MEAQHQQQVEFKQSKENVTSVVPDLLAPPIPLQPTQQHYVNPNYLRTISGNNILPHVPSAVDEIAFSSAQTAYSSPSNNEAEGYYPIPNMIASSQSPQSFHHQRPSRHSSLRPKSNYLGDFSSVANNNSEFYHAQRPQQTLQPKVNDEKTTSQSTAGENSSIWNMANLVGSKMMSGLDLVGEKLADVLGITSPRYSAYTDEAIKYQKNIAADQEKAVSNRNANFVRQEMSKHQPGYTYQHGTQHASYYEKHKVNTIQPHHYQNPSVKTSTYNSLISSAKNFRWSNGGKTKSNDCSELV